MTDRLDLGSYVYDEGYFLLRAPVDSPPSQAAGISAPLSSWESALIKGLTYTPEPNDTGVYQHVFSYRHSRPTIKEAALRLLATAQHKVFLASFRIGDTDLLKALYEAADRLRGGVYVISALDENSLRKGLQTEDAEAPDADDLRAQNKRFEDMTSRGIAVRGHENFHAKFLIVDDREALVASANLETSALTGTQHRAATGENGFVVSDPAEVIRLARYFTRLWHACTYEMPPGQDHTVQQRPASPSPCRVPQAGGPPSVIWTYPGELGILPTVHDVIGRARRNLLLATYSLNRLTEEPDLLLARLEAAIRAHRLTVWLLLRARNNHAPTRRDAKALAALGVRIYGDSLTHVKAAIADERYGALFSANFDAEHGLNSGAEAGVLLDDHPALDEAVRYLRHVMAHADLTFAPNPTQREMDKRLAAGWRTAWPFEPDIPVTCSDDEWQRLGTAVRRGPVLYTHTRNDELRLHAGDRQWLLAKPGTGGTRKLNAVDRAAHGDSSQLLESWLTARTQRLADAPTRRGFCPAVLLRAPT
jgi:phosphatidylserine/phosphatidylglycerophosphate/cardiolipin synthase-like enzyme